MQALTADPRTQMSAGDVVALITAPDLEVDPGLDLLDDDDEPIADWSDHYEPAASSITWTGANDIAKQCSITITRPLVWGVDRVRMRTDLTSRVLGLSGRFYRGVFVLTLPSQDSDDQTWAPDDLDPAGAPALELACTGWDKLALLKRLIGASWSTLWSEVGGQVLIGAEVRRLLAAAGWTGKVSLDPALETKALTGPMTWPYDSNGGVTWLRAAIDLLASGGGESPWCDEVGTLHSRILPAATARPSEWTFDPADPRTIVGPKRTRTIDVSTVPNAWRYMASTWPRTPVIGDGIYEPPRNTSAGPASIAARRGLVVWNSDVAVDAVDQAALVAQGDAKRQADLALLGTRSLTVGHLPLMGHLDVLSFVDPQLGDPVRTLASTWTEHADGTDTDLTVQEVFA